MRVPKASDILADRLRSKILGEGLRPGDELPSEGELIETHGFSRGTVRETLRLLEAEGLVVVKRGPGGGVRVTHPEVITVSRSLALFLSTSQATLRHFFALRKLVEPAAAQTAAAEATDTQREWLLSIAGETRGRRHAALEGSADFHGAIGQCSNNQVLEVVVSSMHHVLTWHTSGEDLSPDDIEATRQVHLKIATSIAQGNAKSAGRQMLSHLERFESILEDQGRLDEQIMPGSRWLPV
jgi:GntR family transcriptional repressor for pyruvate dehydrogenase complex